MYSIVFDVLNCSASAITTRYITKRTIKVYIITVAKPYGILYKTPVSNTSETGRVFPQPYRFPTYTNFHALFNGSLPHFLISFRSLRFIGRITNTLKHLFFIFNDLLGIPTPMINAKNQNKAGREIRTPRQKTSKTPKKAADECCLIAYSTKVQPTNLRCSSKNNKNYESKLEMSGDSVCIFTLQLLL